MLHKIGAFLICFFLSTNVCSLYAAIGDWKAYMAYYDVQDVEQEGNIYFVQASNGLYVYNKNDESIQTFSKMDGLNDSYIQKIAYNKSSKSLLIVYDNSNMDVMNATNFYVNSLADLYNYSTTSNKTITDVYIYGKYAYVSCGFGIIKVNMAKAEISETYNLGFKIDWCEIKDNKIYAYSSEKGQYSASLTANLIDKSNWTQTGDYTNKVTKDKSELINMAKTLNPGGPKYNYFWFLNFTNNQLYTSGGGFGHGNINPLRPGTIQVLNGDEWTIYEDSLTSKTGLSYTDINAVDVDPLNPQHVFAGGKNGLYEFMNGKFVKFYNSDNSLITSYKSNKEIEVIGGLKFDKEGNLWMVNPHSSHNQSLIEYSKDGEWVSCHSSKLQDEEKNQSLSGMEYLMFDSRGYLWFVNNYWTNCAFFRYQPSTKTLTRFENLFNQDGTNIGGSAIQCIAEDKDHNIWIGTNKNTFMLEANEAETNNPTFIQVKVPRNDGTNTADYLLDGLSFTAIVVDGANRKWFATKDNGVYLISADNLTEIHHFTQDNSKLLSNNIESMAINDNTGEVFFGTDKGLCSYMSDASKANDEMSKDNVYAYPNPVRPEYTGNITIMGLSMNADVKIVTSSGVLVNQGQSNGGTYIWNGKDLKGKNVASGVYMVETATSEGKKGTVCKIAIIR